MLLVHLTILMLAKLVVDNMRVTAGIAIILNKEKVLLIHPTNAKWWGTYSIPKGGVEDGETFREAASRETFEEVGIHISQGSLGEANKIEYSSGKLIWYYVYHINSVGEIGLLSEIVPKNMLQKEEVDWAGFVSFKDAKKRLLPPQYQVLKNHFT